MPCFNHGKYIQEALDSIRREEITCSYEVVIVDDGSTDPGTLSKLDELKSKGYTVIHQKNAGPAAARNTAIAAAKGKYILPLDSDNKLTAEYINTAIPLLEEGAYHIVYCSPLFFGDPSARTRHFRSKPFDIDDLLEHNYIDSCAFFLKEVWVKNKGFDVEMPHFGHEDWEFWINAYAQGFKFLFLKKKLFHYRVLGNSEADKFRDAQKLQESHGYIIRKHLDLFLDRFIKLNYLRRKYARDINRSVLSSFIYLGYKMNISPSPFKKVEKK